MPLQLPHLLLLPERAPQGKAAEAAPAQQPGIDSLRASGWATARAGAAMKEQQSGSNSVQWFRKGVLACAEKTQQEVRSSTIGKGSET